MKTLASPPKERRDFGDLAAFLRKCREEARRAQTFRIASISLRVTRIDPLAVLESIFEPAEQHFYLEKNGSEEAIAGADGIVGFTGGGANRFADARAFIDDALSRTVCIGDLDAPLSGPLFFCAFTFFDDPGPESPFPGVTVFVPRWQVARRGSTFTATANVRIDPDAKIEPLAEKIWRAHQRFSSFDYRRQPVESSPPAGRAARPIVNPESKARFEATVEKALALIGNERLRKVVVARCLDVDLPEELNPLHALNRLRIAYPSCFTYSVANGRGQSMIGVSPERLARRSGSRLDTEALAGSAPRGTSASEDAALAGELLRSVKDNWEHQLVIDSISRRLAGLGVSCEVMPAPDLLQLANVQHLRTAVAGEIPEGIHLLDILGALHPTPAVGGTPREAAAAAIRELEPFPRGLYAGGVGWVDSRGDGDFTVAIRSTLIDRAKARVFAGAGIVEGSIPDREWNETEVKLRAVLEAL